MGSNNVGAKRQSLIRAKRQALGLSTAALAQRLGVSQSTVVRMEDSESKQTISLSTLRRAAAALNCSMNYSLEDTSTAKRSARRAMRQPESRQPSRLGRQLTEIQRVAQHQLTWQSRFKLALELSDFALRYKKCLRQLSDKRCRSFEKPRPSDSSTGSQ